MASISGRAGLDGAAATQGRRPRRASRARPVSPLLALEAQRLHLEQVDDALERALEPDRELEDDGMRAEPVAQHRRR